MSVLELRKYSHKRERSELIKEFDRAKVSFEDSRTSNDSVDNALLSNCFPLMRDSNSLVRANYLDERTISETFNWMF